MAMPALDPDRIFLPTKLPGDDRQFLPPARRGAKVTPLIDAKVAYAAMEEAILKARSTVHLCWWEFDPFTPLTSNAVRRAVGGAGWVDLLLAKARGTRVPPAHVRMIISDSDAVFFKTMHAKAWAAAEIMQTRRKTMGAPAQMRLEVFVGLHPAVVTSFAALDIVTETVLETLTEAKLASRRDELNAIIADAGTDIAAIDAAITEAKDQFRNLPGLWPNIRFDAASSSFSLVTQVALSLRPASHHQKLCLIDGEIAFCGGLDIAPERLDDQRHGARFPWHDIQCKVEGAPVFDIERNFFSRWNAELELFREFVAAANTAQPPFQVELPSLIAMATQAGAAAFERRPGKSRVQVIRTLSGEIPNGESVPATIRRDIEESYFNAIANAEQFLYLENQYVRWPALADKIIARHQQRAIKVILVVPTLPEEVRAATRDPMTNHALFLQNQFLQRLAAGLGDDFGLFALTQRRFASGPDPLNLLGAAQVYVHSKIMIVDDVFATIGSANTNGRGFHIDSELNIAWTDPSAVRAFRLKLWAELLGRPRDLLSWKPLRFMEKWRTIAVVNSAFPPAARQGFVVPGDLATTHVGEKLALGLPEPDKFV